jgi:hypothetical protein
MSQPAFFLQVCGERRELLACLQRLRRVYPVARVMLRFDGDQGDKSLLAPLFADPHVEVYEDPRLQGVECGGQSCQRMLDLFLAGSGEVLVKIDADTDLRRPFAALPAGQEVYYGGSLQESGGLRSIQGGCIVMSRRFCERLAQSRLLLAPRLGPPELAWAQGSRIGLWRARVVGLSSHDWTLGYVAAQLGIPPQQHGEVLSRWRSFRLSDVLWFYRATAVHPVRHGTTRWLGPWGPANVLQHILEGLELLELRTLPRGQRSVSPFGLNTADFTACDLPPTILEWLCSHLGSPRALLWVEGCDKSRRELGKYFGLTVDPAQADGWISRQPPQDLSGAATWVLDGLHEPSQWPVLLRLAGKRPYFEIHGGRRRAVALFPAHAPHWVKRIQALASLARLFRR